MKIQTTAIIEQLSVGGKFFPLDENQTIELEFSAIDTGGGFKDPILDFSFSINPKKNTEIDIDQHCKIGLTLRDPRENENEVTFFYEGIFRNTDGQLVVNGRMNEKKLSKELIGFVMKRLR